MRDRLAPRLGLHLMGRNTAEKVANVIANTSGGRIAPVEMIARKLSICSDVGLDRGSGGGVGGVREGSGNAVLLPADVLICDRVFEAVLIVVEAG